MAIWSTTRTCHRVNCIFFIHEPYLIDSQFIFALHATISAKNRYAYALDLFAVHRNLFLGHLARVGPHKIIKRNLQCAINHISSISRVDDNDINAESEK